MSYYDKYMKYKDKYIVLKNQFGSATNVNELTDANVNELTDANVNEFINNRFTIINKFFKNEFPITKKNKDTYDNSDYLVKKYYTHIGGNENYSNEEYFDTDNKNYFLSNHDIEILKECYNNYKSKLDLRRLPCNITEDNKICDICINTNDTPTTIKKKYLYKSIINIDNINYNIILYKYENSTEILILKKI